MGLAMVLMYDGTAFHGFERQGTAGPRTVQGVLEERLGRLLGPGHIRGASRTDAGVHAHGQVVYWTGLCRIPLERLPAVLNRALPTDVVVARVAALADPAWDPRRHAVAKAYSYRIWCGSEPCPPDVARYCYAPGRALDLAAMRRAAQWVEGRHDFRAFRREGSSARTTVRTVYRAAFGPEADHRVWRLELVANGFLYQMARMIAGGLLLVGEGHPPELFRRHLEQPTAGKVGRVAPSAGLCLERVWLQPDPFAG